MKKWWLIIPAGLALLLFGAVTVGDKFVLNVFQWAGLSSDELIATDFTNPADMMNFEIGREGDKTFLQERGGFHQITPAFKRTGTGTTSLRAATIYHLDLGNNPDRELIVVLAIDGDTAKFSACDRKTRAWYTVKGNVGEGTDSTVPEVFNSALSGLHNNFVQYNGYLFGAASTRTYSLQGNANGDLKRINKFGATATPRLLVHQSRLYTYSVPAIATSASTCELDWMRDFAFNFDSLGTCMGCGLVWIGKSDGDFLTNVLSVGSNIVAFKTHSIYSLLVSSTSNAPDVAVKVTDNLGCIAFDAAVAYNGVAYFIAADGVYSFDGSSCTKLSDALNYWFADSLVRTNPITSDIIKLQVVGDRLYAILPVRSSSDWTTMASGGFRLFVYDLRLQTWWKIMPGAYPITGSHFYLLSYNLDPTVDVDYDSACGGPYYKPKLFLVADSAGYPCVYMYPNDGYGSDDGVKFTATYTTPMVPVGGSMWDRKQLERAALFGSAAAACSVRVDWYGEGNSLIDSTKFAVTTGPRMALRRLAPTIEGSLLKYRIRVVDSLRVKINALEIIGSQKGMKPDE